MGKISHDAFPQSVKKTQLNETKIKLVQTMALVLFWSIIHLV